MVRRDVVVHRGGPALDLCPIVRLWPVVLATVPAPAWLPDLAEALAGHRLRDDGSPEPVLAERLQALSSSLGSLPADDFYARWSQWFFVQRMQPHPPEFK